MRLINVHSRKIIDFPDDQKAPPYAIASHRWTANEITYQDYIHGERRQTSGFAKVEGFCKCVKQRFALSFLWIDTVCIDKTSSAELSEAITSMYRWYAEAEVCIAYMADVQAGHSIPNWHESCINAFERSVWFTRGWTLQELLAPKLVVFLNCTFEFVIGHKNGTNLPNDTFAMVFGESLNTRISVVTGIPIQVIYMTARSKELSIDERTSWMDRRATTRPEDRAYCMIGICGVSLVPNYGEREHAMRRLKNEVRQLALEEDELRRRASSRSPDPETKHRPSRSQGTKMPTEDQTRAGMKFGKAYYDDLNSTYGKIER